MKKLKVAFRLLELTIIKVCYFQHPYRQYLRRIGREGLSPRAYGIRPEKDRI